MELIKKVNVNLPLFDVITGMPKYVRFMKNFLTNQKKMESISSVTLNVAYTAVVPNQLPKKLKDLGYFTIPCLLGELDLDERIPLILGRTFLNAARCLIDVYGQQLTLSTGDQNEAFAINKALKYPVYLDDTCYYLQTVDTHVEFLQEFLELQGTCECEIANGEEDMLDEVDLMTTLMAEGYEPIEKEHKELEKANAYRSKTLIEEPPELELKPLPEHLEYTFLQEESKLPVIIAADLSVSQKSKLVFVLKAHKPAISWKIQDIKGISPSYCTHKILMEDNFKLCVQRQR
ncbi:uncharacterized protein [Rutidosis leptorrhynchoides]|uniref:uncharacterized protein n=1 Tax=Rutidosis leptorrhynchoides TaxID=125765 RepID=UPI003A9A3B2A